MPDKALGTIKVLEYAQFVAGPYCTKLMADLGAEVIKIEPAEGDVARRRGPFPGDIPHPERSGLYLYLNTNKLGITLNLKSSKGRDIFKKLIKETDIFIEDTPPGELKRLGLGYENLKEINPRLIMTSITPFGQTGPYKDYKAYYLNLSHSSGLGYITPLDVYNPHILEREPTREGGFIGEYDSALFSAVATLAALYSRRNTGNGQHIDISKHEMLLSIHRLEMAAHFRDGHIINRADPLTALKVPNVYPCYDGYACILFTSEERHWQGFIELMGNPDWTREERFSTPQKRYENAWDIYQRASLWTALKSREYICSEAQERGCPAAPIYKVGEVPDTEHMKARAFFVEVDHPQAGKLGYASGPAKFSKTPFTVEHPAPCLGEHNHEIYCRRLGFSEPDLAMLSEKGII